MTKDVIGTISGSQFAQETETEPVEDRNSRKLFTRKTESTISSMMKSWRDLREARKISSS